MRPLVVLAIALISVSAYSQKDNEEVYTVHGQVTSFKHFMLRNVEISAKKSRTKALTDSLGQFSIMARPRDILVFKANGFQPGRRKVTEDDEYFNVNMIFVESKKNEKVAVGYGYMDEEDLTHALTNYRHSNNDFEQYSSMYNLMSAELPGARVTQSLDVFIRGSENVMKGATTNTGAALFVVDGIVANRIDYLTPRDIATITLLKGAEAAIYGSRSANGVVLISTRQGME